MDLTRLGARAAIDDARAPRLPERTTTGDDPAAIRDAAAQFEAVFMHQVFKSMRATVPTEDGLCDAGFGGQVFQDMLDEQYATLASRTGELGLGALIAAQLGAPPAEDMPALGPPALAPPPDAPAIDPLRRRRAARAYGAPPAAPAEE